MVALIFGLLAVYLVCAVCLVCIFLIVTVDPRCNARFGNRKCERHRNHYGPHLSGTSSWGAG